MVIMYKKQLTVQRILCLAAVIVSAIVFLYALGIMTDLYDALYDTMRNPNNIFQTDVAGSIVYYNMQEFNKVFLNYSIVLLILGAFLYVTNTHSRRRYYIANYVSIGLFTVFSVYLAIFAHRYIEIFKQQWLQVDFAALKAHSEMWGTLYTESTFWFDIHYLVFALLLIVACALVANAVWKNKLMKEEDQLVEEGRRVLQ
jgi:hypothetical protein